MPLWYHKEKDVLFLSGYLHGMFCALQPLDWDQVEIIDLIEGEYEDYGPREETKR